MEQNTNKIKNITIEIKKIKRKGGVAMCGAL
jgi:hypothetical protein